MCFILTDPEATFVDKQTSVWFSEHRCLFSVVKCPMNGCVLCLVCPWLNVNNLLPQQLFAGHFQISVCLVPPRAGSGGSTWLAKVHY